MEYWFEMSQVKYTFILHVRVGGCYAYTEVRKLSCDISFTSLKYVYMSKAELLQN